MDHKLGPFQNGMFSITEIGKNRKNREKISLVKSSLEVRSRIHERDRP